jgi:hypothetical protein
MTTDHLFLLARDCTEAEYAAAPNDVPEGAFDVKSLRRSRRPLSPAVMQPGVCLRARASKARLSRVGKGQSRPGSARPSGKPLLPGAQLLSTTMGMDRRQAVLVAFSWSNTADLTIAAENCKGIPIRMHRHSFVPLGRMVCFGHSQVGSFSSPASPNVGGTRRSPSSHRGCVRTVQLASLERQRISPSLKP